MYKNQQQLLRLFKQDLSQLKNNSTTIEKVDYPVSEDFIRSTYKWELVNPVLFFTHAEQIEFNDAPLVLTLKSRILKAGEYEQFLNTLVDILGIDANGSFRINAEKQERESPFISRCWCLDKNHQTIMEYPPQGEGYTIYLSQYNDICTMIIEEFLNLFSPSLSS